MSIKGREDANKYYQLINNLVDEYTERWKIRPSNLKRYLKPGSERFNKFLERNKLKEVIGSERVLRDIIEDRAGMESDGVFTFESYKLLESEEFKIESLKQCLYKGIEKSTMEMEKILADHFDTNLGSIDIIDPHKHIFKLEDWEGDDRKVVIYSLEELDIIKYNILDFIYEELSKKTVKLTESIEMELDSIIDYDVFFSKAEVKFNDQFIVKIITDSLGSEYIFEGTDKVTNGNYFIWIQ